MTRLLILTATLAVLTFPVGAGEKCPLGLCKGERVIIYDQNHRRTHTIENRGYGVLQIRDNDNRRVGTIDSQGRTYDSHRNRTGTIEAPANKLGAGSFWK